MNSNFTVAIVGANVESVAPEHIDALQELDVPRLIVVDPSASVREHWGDRGLEVFADLDEALIDYAVNLTVVAVPDRLHVPISRQALAAGSHVYCEKPLALTVREARELIDAATAAGLQLHHGLQRRMMVQEEFRLAVARLGRIISARGTWRRTEGTPPRDLTQGAGVPGDLAVHVFSQIDEALGLVAVDELLGVAMNTGRNPRVLVEDDAFFVMKARTASGDTVDIQMEVAWEGMPGLPGAPDEAFLEIVGSAGTLRARMLTTETAEEAEAVRPELYLVGSDTVEVLPRLLTVPECHEAMWRHVLASIDGDPGYAPDHDQDLRVLSVIEAFARSTSGGGSRHIHLFGA